MAKAFTTDIINPVLQLHLLIIKKYYVNIQNIPETLKEKSLTKPTEISVSKKFLQETTFRSNCKLILRHHYQNKKKTHL